MEPLGSLENLVRLLRGHVSKGKGGVFSLSAAGPFFFPSRPLRGPCEAWRPREPSGEPLRPRKLLQGPWTAPGSPWEPPGSIGRRPIEPLESLGNLVKTLRGPWETPEAPGKSMEPLGSLGNLVRLLRGPVSKGKGGEEKGGVGWKRGEVEE